MTIQDAKAFVAGLWDWSLLDGCFGGMRIKPTDIDGLVERNGYFLVLETKAPGAEVKSGQMLVFQRMTSTGRFTVLVVWGNNGQPEKMLLLNRRGQQFEYRGGVDMLRYIVSEWFKWANTPEYLK